MTPTLALLAALTLPARRPRRPFAVTVVDEQTGRGVPLVELKTVNEVRYVTDSAGVAAVDEPGLMGTIGLFSRQEPRIRVRGRRVRLSGARR